MKIKPMGTRVTVDVKKKEKKTDSGIILAQSSRRVSTQGKVLLIGDTVDIKVAIGDTVIFSPNAGVSVKDGDLEVIILDEEHILAVKEEE